MQNRYVGDIGDFGKYGMLRHIARNTGIPMAVNWCLHPDQDHLNDGKQTRYLQQTHRNLAEFRAVDSPLYDSLLKIVESGQRSVAAVRDDHILPQGTAFFDQPLQYPAGSGLAERREIRKSWQEAAHQATQSAGLVFLDPDNGMSATVSPLSKSGPKYCFKEDLIPYLEERQSLVIYHHLGRQKPAWEQITGWKQDLRETLALPANPLALRYRRGSPRVYLIIPSPRHQSLLQTAVDKIAQTPWVQHFQAA